MQTIPHLSKVSGFQAEQIRFSGNTSLPPFQGRSVKGARSQSRYFRYFCLFLLIMSSKRQIGRPRVFHLQNHGHMKTENDFPADVYKTWTGVHGPPDGPGPWTTPWTTPNFQKEITLVNMKIYRRSGYEELLTSLRVCLVIAGCFELKALERVMLPGNLPPPKSCFI